jgi:hypothetical protein
MPSLSVLGTIFIDMAGDFLNCGNSALMSAAHTWLNQHGYTVEWIKTQSSSDYPKWGKYRNTNTGYRDGGQIAK